jgi:hypothetical protein
VILDLNILKKTVIDLDEQSIIREIQDDKSCLHKCIYKPEQNPKTIGELSGNDIVNQLNDSSYMWSIKPSDIIKD